MKAKILVSFTPTYARFIYLIDSAQGYTYKDTRMDTIWAFRNA